MTIDEFWSIETRGVKIGDLDGFGLVKISNRYKWEPIYAHLIRWL